jgi:hypothetical protein
VTPAARISSQCQDRRCSDAAIHGAISTFD